MIIVADRVLVGELLEIRHIALLDIVKTHRGRAFTRRLVSEVSRLRLAVAARPDRHLDPWEQVVQAAAWIARGRMRRTAIDLLIHLVIAMDRALRIGVIGHTGRQLEWPRGQARGIRDSRVDAARRKAGRAGCKQRYVGRKE